MRISHQRFYDSMEGRRRGKGGRPGKYGAQLFRVISWKMYSHSTNLKSQVKGLDDKTIVCGNDFCVGVCVWVRWGCMLCRRKKQMTGMHDIFMGIVSMIVKLCGDGLKGIRWRSGTCRVDC